ncbi:hypothetical protein [Pontibacillus litoralis]|uniref:Phage head-tail adapter protein n=1 Tax=Pontibacillus litoralis JSM 072002 TaxID=1385512 RepID=A0A0A5HWQ4_9BACI|nr:hypothetical protein [Pontibacillus litoralis]KGX88037.1 hypothetical protein N784_13025 [Pontibacillus litoralis JSM 072002]
MRYTDRVKLHKTLGRGYNPETGKNEVIVDEGVLLPCNASPVTLEKTAAVFGSLNKKVATVRLQRPYKDYADKAVIEGQKYNVLRHIPYKSESVFYLEGVSEWS